MTLAIRLVAVLTALLSVGVMAVSAYAAKTAPANVSVANEAPAIEPATPAASDPSVSGAQEPETTPLPEPVRTPGARFRFAAPDSAERTGPRNTAGSNLSPGVCVWSVPSVRSGLFSAGGSGTGEIPPDQLVAMQQTGGAFGVPWQVLAAISKVESDFGRNMSTSTAGAIGYGQFLPEQWQIYGAGGDPYDYHDALLAMARYLVVAGAPAAMADAVYAYNHSWEYVEAVLSYASGYGYSSGTNGASFIWPVLGAISSYFGPAHPLGIDIDQSASADAPVWAAHAGDVIFAGGDPCCSYGNYVIVDGGAGIATLYAHLSAIAVQQGDRVSQGATLGTAGCTGTCSGPHLHFEVIDHGVRRDPLLYLPGGY